MNILLKFLTWSNACAAIGFPAMFVIIAPALGFEIRECSLVGVDLTNIVTPVTSNISTAYDGKITLFNVDTIEPACCSAGFAIVLPDVENELQASKCVALTGLAGANIVRARRSYDQARGLLLTLPTAISTPTGTMAPGPVLRIRINLKKSSVELEGRGVD